jgi:hypothetical protein
LAGFLFLAWKQGLYTSPKEQHMFSTTTGTTPLPVNQAGRCWDNGTWYNGSDNFLKDDGCTVCVCNGEQHTLYCTTNTERPDCVAKAAQY